MMLPEPKSALSANQSAVQTLPLGPHNLHGQFRAATGIRFDKDFGENILDGLFANRKLPCYLFVARAACDKSGDLAFALAQQPRVDHRSSCHAVYFFDMLGK
jgi:hypothetical protein